MNLPRQVFREGLTKLREAPVQQKRLKPLGHLTKQSQQNATQHLWVENRHSNHLAEETSGKEGLSAWDIGLKIKNSEGAKEKNKH